MLPTALVYVLISRTTARWSLKEQIAISILKLNLLAFEEDTNLLRCDS